MFPCCCRSAWHGHDAVWGFGKKRVGGAWDGDWRLWLSSSDVIFLQKSQGLVKNHSYFIQAVWALLWIDRFETYIVVTAPRPLLSWKKPGNVSFDNMGPLIEKITKSNIIRIISWILKLKYQYIKAKSKYTKWKIQPKWKLILLILKIIDSLKYEY